MRILRELGLNGVSPVQKDYVNPSPTLELTFHLETVDKKTKKKKKKNTRGKRRINHQNAPYQDKQGRNQVPI